MSGVWRLLVRYRRALILSTTLVLAFLLMTLQVRHDRAVVSFTRQAILFALSPVLKVTSVTTGSVMQVWQDYVDLRTLREENHRLTRDAAVLKRRISQLEEQALETLRLQRMLPCGRTGPRASSPPAWSARTPPAGSRPSWWTRAAWPACAGTFQWSPRTAWSAASSR
jgi:hypothetical protein